MRKKKVLLSVTGIVQDAGMEDCADEMRLVTTGELSGEPEQNAWKLRYTETQPDTSETDRVTFTMKDYEGSYNTPYGALEMGVFPTHVRYNVNDAKGEVVLKYQLDIQGQYASMREMRIRFAPSHRA